jgi:hypothetical protein
LNWKIWNGKKCGTDIILPLKDPSLEQISYECEKTWYGHGIEEICWTNHIVHEHFSSNKNASPWHHHGHATPRPYCNFFTVVRKSALSKLALTYSLYKLKYGMAINLEMASNFLCVSHPITMHCQLQQNMVCEIWFIF